MNKMPRFLYIFLIIALFSVFCFSGWKLLTYYKESTETQAGYDELSQLRQEAVTVPTARPVKPVTPETIPSEATTAPTETEPDPNAGLTLTHHPETGAEVWMREEFCALYAINPDIVGWITLEGTNIDYPVVQRPQDKDYYLKRDFYGKKASRGCIYAREECDIFKPSDNVVLYGHMMKDATMFADLNGYKYEKFWKENPYIRFDTLREPGLYEVILAFKTSATVGHGFSYHLYTDFESETELMEFWQECTARAYYQTGITPQWGDKLLTLSTCEYTLENGRLVVIARRIDP